MAQAQRSQSSSSPTRASFRPSDMIQLGLPSNFNGTITKAVACPWDYNGSIPEHVLALRLDFEPDEDSGFDPFSQYYSLGSLKFWAPSQDGVNPVDLDGDDITEMEGPYLVWVGPDKVPENARFLGKETNVEHFMAALIESGFDESNMAEDLSISWLEGVYGYWVRVGQKKREGLKNDKGGENSDKTILVCAEYKSGGGVNAAASSTGAGSKAKGGTAGKGAAGTKGNTSTSTSASKSSASTGKTNGATAADLDTQVADMTVSILREMLDEEEGTYHGKFTEIRGRVFKSFKGADAARALKLFNSDGFHTANKDRWASEGKDGELTLLEE